MAQMTNKLVFLHIPKTGGTWVSRAIQRWNIPSRSTDNGQHSTWSLEKDCKRISDKSFFTAIRCPVNWYKSAYRFVYKNRSFPPPGETIGKLNTLAFHNFIRDVMECWELGLWGYYWQYVEGCTFLIHTERLEIELIELLKQVGEVFQYVPLPKINASVTHIPAVWSIRQLELVRTRDYRVFEEFGYDVCFNSSKCIERCEKEKQR